MNEACREVGLNAIDVEDLDGVFNIVEASINLDKVDNILVAMR